MYTAIRLSLLTVVVASLAVESTYRYSARSAGQQMVDPANGQASRYLTRTEPPSPLVSVPPETLPHNSDTEAVTRSLHAKNHPAIKAVFRNVVEDAARSTVQVLGDQQPIVLGTVVGQAGWIVTKFSELRGNIQCRLSDGRLLDARLAGTDRAHDVALLHVSAEDLRPARWSDQLLPVGGWLASPGADGEPLAVGVVSIGSRALSQISGILGVRIKTTRQGVHVSQVLPGTGAAEAGLQMDDTITRIEGIRITDKVTLFQAVQQHSPGEILTVEFVRDQQHQRVPITLGYAWKHGGTLTRTTGQLSRRRDGFPQIFQHDGFLKPSTCGGPVCDLEGRVVGINIARADRVACYAIPAATIQAIVSDLKSPTAGSHGIQRGS